MLIRKDVAGERRQYARLNSVFPVEFQILDANGAQILSNWMEGFTSDISRGGMRLAINNVNAEMLALLTKKDIQLSLSIRIPLGSSPTQATAEVVWLSKVGHPATNQYQMGIKYLMIERIGFKRIMRYARWRRFIGWLKPSFQQ